MDIVRQAILNTQGIPNPKNPFLEDIKEEVERLIIEEHEYPPEAWPEEWEPCPENKPQCLNGMAE